MGIFAGVLPAASVALGLLALGTTNDLIRLNCILSISFS